MYWYNRCSTIIIWFKTVSWEIWLLKGKIVSIVLLGWNHWSVSRVIKMFCAVGMNICGNKVVVTRLKLIKKLGTIGSKHKRVHASSGQLFWKPFLGLRSVHPHSLTCWVVLSAAFLSYWSFISCWACAMLLLANTRVCNSTIYTINICTNFLILSLGSCKKGMIGCKSLYLFN